MLPASGLVIVNESHSLLLVSPFVGAAAMWPPWVGYVAAGVAMVCTLAGVLSAARIARTGSGLDDSRSDQPAGWVRVYDVAALAAGIVAVFAVILPLSQRIIAATREVLAGSSEGLIPRDLPGVAGLVVIAMLIGTCLLDTWARRNFRLISVAFALFVMALSWAALSHPLFRRLDNATWERMGTSLTLVVGLSVLLCLFVRLRFWLADAARRRAIHDNPEDLLESFVEWPVFRKTAGAIGLLLILLISYELASSPLTGSVTGRVRCIILTLCAASAGVAMFRLFVEKWSDNFADAAMGLLTLAAGSLSLVLLPAEPAAAASRFPLVFTSLLVAFAVMTWLWVWLGRVWCQQLDDGEAWTAGGRLSLSSAVFGFFVACVALVNGSVMAFWPRFRSVGVFDDSVGRMAAGMGGYLLLLLVLLWSRRTSGRAGFGILALLAVFSMLSFLAVRAGPLSSRDHYGGVVQTKSGLVEPRGGQQT